MDQLTNNKSDNYTIVSIILAILCITIPIVINPDQAQTFISTTYQRTVDIFGPSYMILGVMTLLFLVTLSVSKYGKFKLGGENSSPEFSNFSWSSMLFCSGIGGGILYWSGVEWAYYVSRPPFGIEPFSEGAYHLASAYGMFHWGLTGWALYCLPAIAIAIPFYHYNLGSLRLSSGLRTNKNSAIENSFIGRLVDLIFVIILIGASGGTIGMYVPIIGAGLSEVFGINHDLILDLSMLSLCTLMFGASVYRGIDKGIKILSNFNVLLALTFLILIFFLGSFQEIIALSIEAIKSLFTNFVGMNSLGITEQSDFADDWTIFYWAWWLALGPQVGLFVARISKGRTLRELVMGMLIIGSLGCFIFFAILGNYAINLELSNQLIVTDILANDGHQIAATAILLQLPFGELFVLAYCLIVIIFIVTSYDSVSYILSYHVKTTASEAYEPSKNMRLFWALVLAILPACLFLIGSNRTAMDLILLMSPPLLFLSPIFALSMIKTLRSHYALKDSTMDKNISE